MSWDQFFSGMKDLEDHLKKAAGSVMKDLDRTSYRMLIDGLKSSDPESVKVTIDQLVKERRPVAIAPVYFVSVAHPVPWVRLQASNALKQMLPEDELKKLTEGKDIKTSVGALLEKYGHFRS